MRDKASRRCATLPSTCDLSHDEISTLSFNEPLWPSADIAAMKTSRQSFMPEGLAAGLSPQDLADVIEFLFEPVP